MSTSTLRAEFAGSPDGSGDWTVSISSESEWGDYGMEEWQAIEANGKPALPYLGPLSGCPGAVLDKPFNTGYGAPSRPCYAVWTTDYIITCTEYHGSTNFRWTNRNPVPL